jgi:hypothetical protein
MALNMFDVQSNLAGLNVQVVSMEGTGAAAPTKLYGPGITITRTSEGLYKFTWSDAQGVLVGMLSGMGASTPSAMAGFTLSHDDKSGNTVEVLLSEADNSVVDLADNQYVTLAFLFKTTGV